MSLKSGPPIKRRSIPLIGKSAESFQIGPLSPSLSESLTKGTSIPAPLPPAPPSKETAMPPSTPQPKSSSNYMRNSPRSGVTASMPGTYVDDDDDDDNEASLKTTITPRTTSKLKSMGYEASASVSASPYASSSQPSSSSKSSRRPSSIFRLLPFKRSFNGRASSSADSFSTDRPQTPSADSIVPSLAESSTLSGTLRKRKSGSFWGRRKSSLNLVTGADEMGQQQSQDAGARSNGNGTYGGHREEDGEEEFPPRLKTKKSGTFWKRRSSLGLDAQVATANQRQSHDQGNGSTSQRQGTNGQPGWYQNGVGDAMGGGMAEPDSITIRSRSPPPKLPEVQHVLSGEGKLMGEENWFANIG
ncbi:MAG: hypothetical protein Q9190_006200 [Brigantiaea leucoxantha]